MINLILIYFYTQISVITNPCVLGDVNNDGKITGADIAWILAFWGTNFIRADLNLDGIVNGADLGLLLLYWHDCILQNK